MIPVAFTVSCARQNYLRRALNSWHAVRGVSEAGLLFALEPPGSQFPMDEFLGYLSRAFPGQCLVQESNERLGCLKNTRRAMDMALSAADFGAVAEEDLAVADDVLEYLTWARDAYRDDPQVVAVCAHARSSRLTDPAAVTRASWFNPLVWGTWKDRWEDFIRPGWGPCPGNAEGWDRNLQVQVSQAGRQAVFPVRSRVVHFGETSTMSSLFLSEYFYREFLSDCYAPHYEPQGYQEIPYPAEPGDLVV